MKFQDKNKKITENKGLKHLVVMPRLVQNIGDGYSFPLGIPYISASMKSAGHHVKTLNLNHHDGKIIDIIEEKIKKDNIDVVSTGGLSFQYSTIKEVIESVKRINDKITTIVGGGIITSDPETAMEALEYVDYGVIGEGEKTIQELCAVFEHGNDFSKVNGLIYKDKKNYIKTSPREEITDLDSITWPDYEGFELDKFLLASPSISGINRKNTVFMIASRSCPYRCTFCFHTVGQKYRQRSLDSFFEELEHMTSKHHIDYVCLADELFSVNPRRVKEFCERIKKYNINWWAQFRVDHITKNPDLLPLLKESGCDVMSFGLESADNSILKSMKKKTTIEQAEKALKLVYNSGIHAEGAFIFGDTEETWKTASNTLNWWKSHSEYKITLNLITIYPGTHLYKEAFRRGLIKDKIQFLKEGCPQVNVSKLSDSEVSELVREIVEAPMTLTKTLSVKDSKIIDYSIGRIELTGDCEVCKKSNYWNDIKLFSSNFLSCKSCGQRYNLLLPEKYLEDMDKNIEKLIDKYDKIGFWGINYHGVNLFKRVKTLRESDIYPIEISEMKRKMKLYGREISSPDIIDKEGIGAVIVPIPAYINEITSRIRKNYPGVKKIIDICELVNPNYEINN